MASPGNKRLLIVNSASGLAERFVNLLLQVWLYQYLVKRISPEEYSLYPVLTALLVFVPPMMAVLTSGLARYTVEAHTRDDDRRVTEITSTMFPLLLVTGLVLALVGFLVAQYLGSILRIVPERLWEARLMVLLLFGSLAFRMVLVPFGVGLYVRQKFVVANTLTMIQTLIRLGLLFVLLLGISPRVLWVVVATVAADLALVVATTILSVRALPALKFRFDHIHWKLVSTLTTFGFWSMIGWFAYLIRKSADVLILNRFGTALNVTTYHLSSLPDNQIEAALQKGAYPLEPHMVALHTTGGPGALHGIYTRGGRYCMWAALLVATPLIAFRHEVWSHYLGSTLRMYADAPLVMMLLLARYWIECPIYLIGMVAQAVNQVRNISILLVLMAVSNLALTIYLVRELHMGAVGSAVGTLVASVVWEPFILWGYCLKLLGMPFGPWFRASVWRGVVPSLIAGGFGFGWRYLMEPRTLPALGCAVTAVGLVYVLSLLFFCLDEEERRELNQLLGRFYSQARAYKAVAVK